MAPTAPKITNAIAITRWRSEKNECSRDAMALVQPNFVFGGEARARNQGYRMYAARNAIVAPTAPPVPRCFMDVAETSMRLMKPSNMHTALQNDGTTVSFTAAHTAACPTNCFCCRIPIQL